MNLSFHIISAHLGHLRVLCVVVVMISKYPKGPSIAHHAINHAICAISAIKIGLYQCFFSTSLAISQNFFQSINLE
jgi:hypothetical protein